MADDLPGAGAGLFGVSDRVTLCQQGLMEILQMLLQWLFSVFSVSIDDATPRKFSVALQFGSQLSSCGFVLESFDAFPRPVGGLVVDIPAL
ncbi:MAG: hypothetical protein ACYS74_13030 [Planctomycetota bacterium]